MDLSDLHIFKTVAEEGGIARAAHKLHRVPSNISTRVRQLEQSVGAQLFVRDKQRLFLSPSGEHLLGYADKLLRLSAEALGAVSQGPPRGVLRLGSLESTAASRLPQVLAAYHKAYPEVRVELTTGTNDALTAAVLERRVEAAFVVEVPSSPELAAERLFRERLVIVSPLDHAPIRRPPDIDGDSVIAFPNGCAYRRVLQHWLGPARMASVRVLELSSYHAIVACVAAGTGIALVPESVLDTVQHAAVARHGLPKVHAQVTTPLIWRTADASPALLALRKVMATVARAAR
jgi:DNA-binding transcriptional LysR family regulator